MSRDYRSSFTLGYPARTSLREKKNNFFLQLEHLKFNIRASRGASKVSLCRGS